MNRFDELEHGLSQSFQALHQHLENTSQHQDLEERFAQRLDEMMVQATKEFGETLPNQWHLLVRKIVRFQVMTGLIALLTAGTVSGLVALQYKQFTALIQAHVPTAQHLEYMIQGAQQKREER